MSFGGGLNGIMLDESVGNGTQAVPYDINAQEAFIQVRRNVTGHPTGVPDITSARCAIVRGHCPPNSRRFFLPWDGASVVKFFRCQNGGIFSGKDGETIIYCCIPPFFTVYYYGYRSI